MSGPYNAVTPHPVTNRQMTKAIGKVLDRAVWLPPVPSFVLRVVLGEMTDIVVNGSNISPAKIMKTGFVFRFTQLEEALKDLFKRS